MIAPKLTNNTFKYIFKVFELYLCFSIYFIFLLYYISEGNTLHLTSLLS